jgi:hypothetical protein
VSRASFELQLVAFAEAGEVLSIDVVAAPLWSLDPLKVTVTRGGHFIWSSRGRLVVVDKDYNSLQVVAVAANKVSIGGLILGLILGIHNGKFTIEHLSSSIGLTL